MKKLNSKSCPAPDKRGSEKRLCKRVLPQEVETVGGRVLGGQARKQRFGRIPALHSDTGPESRCLSAPTLEIRERRGYRTRWLVADSGLRPPAKTGFAAHTWIPSNGIHHLNILTELSHLLNHTASLQSQLVRGSQAEAL